MTLDELQREIAAHGRRIDQAQRDITQARATIDEFVLSLDVALAMIEAAPDVAAARAIAADIRASLKGGWA